MAYKELTHNQLLLENEELKTRLSEAEKALNAIRNGFDSDVVSHEITARNRAGEELKKSEALYRAIGESIDYGVWICDADGKNIYASESYLKLVGITQEQCSEFGWGDTLHPDDAERTIAAWKECSKNGNFWDIEHRFRGVDGKWHPILARGIPIRDDNGKILMWAGINLDISKIKETEEALRESEDKVRSILTNSLDIIYRVNLRTSEYEFISPSVETIMGYSQAELMSLDPAVASVLVHPEDISILREAQSRSEKMGTSVAEYRYRTKNGEYRWLSNHMSFTKDSEGGPLYREGNIRDITEQKKAEQIREQLLHEIERQAAWLNASISSMATGIILYGPDSKAIQMNETAKKLLPEELFFNSTIEERSKIIKWVTEDGKPFPPEEIPVKRAFNRETTNNVILGASFHDHILWISATAAPILSADGKLMGVVATFLDITENKNAEIALRLSEDRFRNLVKNAPTAIYEIDFATRKFISVNDSMCKFSGYSREELLSTDPLDLLEEDSKNLFLSRISKCMEGEKPDENIEYRVKGKDGRMIDAVLNMKFNFNEKDIPTGAMVVGHDITQRKQAERELRAAGEALKESELRFRTIAESLTVLISIRKIKDSTTSFTNEPFDKAFGFIKDELLGKKLPDIFYYPDDENYVANLLRIKGTVENLEIRVKKKDGTSFWIMTSIRKIVFMDEPCYLTVSTDITEAKKIQEELLRLNRTQNARSKSSQTMMRSKNEQEYLNDVCKIIIEDCGHSMVWIGYAQNNKLKSVKPVAHFGFDKGYIEQLNITWDESPNGNGPTGTAIKTGKPSMCRNMLTDPCFEPWRDAAIKRGYASSIVLPLKSEGKAFGAISIYSKDPDPFSASETDLLNDLADDLAYGIQFIRLTQYEKKAARAIKQNELRLKELIATKDKFFNIIAHDLKNPFTSLLGASELLYDNIDKMPADNVKELSLILNDSAKGGYAILQNLLDWSRSQTGMLKFDPEIFNLKSVIVENIDNLQLQVNNKKITLESELQEDLFITADKNMINTVLRNLLSNAVKYTHKNGSIIVSVLHNRNEITLCVKDTGIGIAKENADKMFQLQNSLSLPGTEKEQGTGLGLKLCKEFIEKMGGRIWVESEIGKGSEFRFSIPVS